MNIYYLSLKEDTPNSGYWDYAILSELFDFDSALIHDRVNLSKDDTAVVVIPGRSHFDVVEKINTQIAKIKHCILFIMGDEEHLFPVEKIVHDSIEIWVQNPEPGRHDGYHRIGCGFTPGLLSYEASGVSQNYAANFAGQVTHSRRRDLVSEVEKLTGVYQKIVKSEGFTQGIPQNEYYELIESSAITYCPSGPVTPDTFRVYEALELGSVPIADTQTTNGRVWENFWQSIFGEGYKMYTYSDTSKIPTMVHEILEEYPKINNRIIAAYQQYKMKLKKKFYGQIGLKPEKYTIVIPTSPLPSHPNTDILEETIKSVRHHSRVGEIIVTFDGVRKEHEERRSDYEEFIRRSLMMFRKYKNITPIIFEEHTHQVGMLKSVIDQIDTEYILYVEQDTPLVIDEPIDWSSCFELLDSGRAHTVRFHFEGVIPKDHHHLMIGYPEYGFQKTIQWSQRPHITRTSEYKRMLSTHFSESAKCFIEDKLHGVIQDEFNISGTAGWDKFRLWIYHPMTGNIKRSYHTDGRAGAAKLDGDQVW